jgi:hypothetical protein
VQVTGAGTLASEKLLQIATNNFAGTCTNSSSATCTATINASYTSTPICLVQDTSSTNKVDATCAVSGTTMTVTVAPTTFSGSCTTASSTTCTIAAPYAFTSSTCIVMPTASASAPQGICSISSTTITVTTASSTSNSYGVILRGTPSASGHSFAYAIIGDPN